MSAAKPIELISIDEYLAGELLAKHKHEYSAGRAYMMAGGRNQHNHLSVQLIGLLHAQLRGRPCQPYNSDTKVRVQMRTHTRFYYPDGMVVCARNPPDETFQDRPVLIAEVLSASTRRIDEGEKLEAYLSIPTLRTYLLIETTSQKVTAYHRNREGVFMDRVYEGSGTTIELKSIGVTLPLDELYERVDFAAAAADDRAELKELDFDVD